MNEETYVDRSDWPQQDGPWLDEPDRAHWVDLDTGYDCLIVRGPSGALCGYVGVPEGHPWHGSDYSAIPYEDAYVHGGLTYAAPCQEDGKIYHTDEEAAHQNVWWLGFDCAHYQDLTPAFDTVLNERAVYRTFAYVTAELQSLAAQIHRVGGNNG
jgi:hypothetical protein